MRPNEVIETAERKQHIKWRELRRRRADAFKMCLIQRNNIDARHTAETQTKREKAREKDIIRREEATTQHYTFHREMVSAS